MDAINIVGLGGTYENVILCGILYSESLISIIVSFIIGSHAKHNTWEDKLQHLYQ